MKLYYYFKKNRNYRLFLFILFFVTIFYFLFKNIFQAINNFNIPLFSFSEKINLFFSSIFDFSELQSPIMLILVFLFIISLSLFLFLSVLLFKESRKIDRRKSIWHTLWIFISILGLSCASCGIGLLASLLSFFGLSYLSLVFPLHGAEFGYLGVLGLFISDYFLLKRLNHPFTC